MNKITLSRSMKNWLIVLILLLFVGGCGESFNDVESLYNEDGSITEYHVELMRAEWCKHNEGRIFVKDQCSGVDY